MLENPPGATRSSIAMLEICPSRAPVHSVAMLDPEGPPLRLLMGITNRA
jgi:hypothetical protein